MEPIDQKTNPSEELPPNALYVRELRGALSSMKDDDVLLFPGDSPHFVDDGEGLYRLRIYHRYSSKDDQKNLARDLLIFVDEFLRSHDVTDEVDALVCEMLRDHIGKSMTANAFAGKCDVPVNAIKNCLKDDLQRRLNYHTVVNILAGLGVRVVFEVSFVDFEFMFQAAKARTHELDDTTHRVDLLLPSISEIKKREPARLCLTFGLRSTVDKGHLRQTLRFDDAVLKNSVAGNSAHHLAVQQSIKLLFSEVKSLKRDLVTLAETVGGNK